MATLTNLKLKQILGGLSAIDLLRQSQLVCTTARGLGRNDDLAELSSQPECVSKSAPNQIYCAITAVQ